jgi:hypothetical protein
MKRLVAYRPTSPGLGKDKLFSDSLYIHVGDASHWMEPSRFLAHAAVERNIELHTDDMVDLAQASALIFGELPMTRHEVDRIRQLYPRLKILLQISETPIGRSWAFDTRNHDCFDAVITYSNFKDGSGRYFNYNIPVGGFPRWRELRPGLPWAQRRCASLVAHVPYPPPKIPRRSGLGMVGAGWKFSARTWWNYVTEGGSLYRKRLETAYVLAGLLPDDFHIFGPSWDVLSNRAISQAWQGPWLGSKLDLLGRYRFNIAYENCLNGDGYITEKVFDALLSGSVPVYLGDERIVDQVPPECFVDARRFASPKELGLFLSAMPMSQWQEMRSAGDKYLLDGAEVGFGAAQFAGAVFGALDFVFQNEDSSSL